MQYLKGQRVVHPSKPDWGLGEVLNHSNGDTVEIFFVGVGLKTLALSYVEPEKIRGAAAVNVHLDNLARNPSDNAPKYHSLAKATDLFLAQYPGGFHGDRYMTEEREYKDTASAKAKDLLDKKTMAGMLKKKAYSDIVAQSLLVLNSTTLVFPNEKMAFRDGVGNEAFQEDYCLALNMLLHGSEEPSERFSTFVGALDDMSATKWTTATYFSFLCNPESQMFVKPTITQNAAALCRWEINYQPKVNWQTYNLILKLAGHLFEGLAELEPRDFIDIQSFMWCVAAKPKA